MAASMNATVTARMQSLLATGKFSDFAIECGGTVFKVHKNIVCTASSYFDEICSKEGFQESRDNRVTLTGFDKDDLERVLYFIYTGKYIVSDPHGESNGELGFEVLRQHVDHYVLADYLGLDDLKLNCATSFENGLRRDCITMIDRDQALRLVKHVIENTPETDHLLRAALVQFCLRAARFGRHNMKEIEDMMQREVMAMWMIARRVSSVEFQTTVLRRKVTCVSV